MQLTTVWVINDFDEERLKREKRDKSFSSIQHFLKNGSLALPLHLEMPPHRAT